MVQKHSDYRRRNIITESEKERRWPISLLVNFHYFNAPNVQYIIKEYVTRRFSLF